jgi:stage V sporulation protein S
MSSYISEPSQGPLPSLEEVGGGLNSVKVSARANVKSIAGAISKQLRSTEMLCATAVGPEGSNHGMKALCIARTYLAADGWDLSATVVEVQPDPTVREGRCFAFVVVRLQVPAKTGDPLCEAGVGRTEPLPRFVRPVEKQTDMKVSGSGSAQTLGGAIAKCLREDKECIITAIGPASVAKCVEAMALARSHVWGDGLQLAFYPGFEQIVMDLSGPAAGEARSAVRVHVWPEAAQQSGALSSTGVAGVQQQQWA